MNQFLIFSFLDTLFTCVVTELLCFFKTDSPEVTVPTTLYQYEVGSSAVLPCNYDAVPDPNNIVWYKDNQVLSLPSANSRLTRGNFSVPNLIISSVDKSDDAIYRCDVTSPLGVGSTGDLTLDVLCKFFVFHFYTFCLLN